MTLLGTGLFLANTLRPAVGSNAAPAIGMVTLNFDLMPNTGPMGADQTMMFEVLPNTAPDIADIALNFDLNLNTPPVGQDHNLVFDVIAG